MDGVYDVKALYDWAAEQISKDRGSWKVHLEHHHTHTSAPMRSTYWSLQGSSGQPGGEFVVYLSTNQPVLRAGPSDKET